MAPSIPSDALLMDRFATIRAQSVALCASLTAEDCGAQSMPDSSPAKWHLAHTTWFFDSFVLAHDPAWTSPDPRLNYLFNSYYDTVGARHERARRGLLTRPTLEDVLAYRRQVDTHLPDWWASLDPDVQSELSHLVEIGLHHEQQHQELLATDITHLFWCNPLRPAWQEAPPPTPAGRPPAWAPFEGGLVDIGHPAEKGFAYDNEGPRHRVWLEPFAIADGLVSNGEYLEFVQAGGYRDPTLWLSEGKACAEDHAWSHPLYWVPGDAGWREHGPAGLQPLEPNAPVRHVSLYEADAYARWRGRQENANIRLPTEFEWEHAATQGTTLRDLFGLRWQWTFSQYLPYPGYRPPDGALGEYNGKFMCNQFVLRGSSCATPAGHARLTYRNFFPPDARWQFTGIRLARSPR